MTPLVLAEFFTWILCGLTGYVLFVEDPKPDERVLLAVFFGPCLLTIAIIYIAMRLVMGTQNENQH